MAETDRIKNALVNVTTLAKNSIEYGKARDDQDIDLIASIVEKGIAKTPIWISGGDTAGYPVYDEWECPNCGTIYEIYSADYDYCPHCGQRIDWSEEE